MAFVLLAVYVHTQVTWRSAALKSVLATAISGKGFYFGIAQYNEQHGLQRHGIYECTYHVP
jgi:hypothetical protein